MAKYLNGLNGPFTGKAGSVIGSSWKDIPYLKGRYKKRTRRISEKEKRNREKFSLSQAWLKPLLDFVRQGFKGYSPRVEGFGAAKSYLLKNCLESRGADLYINPALMRVSYGPLPLSENLRARLSEPGLFEFSWDPKEVTGGSGWDQVMLLAYDIVGKQAFMTLTGQFRSTGRDMLPVQAGKGRSYHLYAAFVAADRSQQSDSLYLGEWETI